MVTDNANAPATEKPVLGASYTTSLFQPDTLLSTQFFDDRRSKTGLEPEKRLMLAILEDAICCFQENSAAKHGKSKRRFDDVKRWLFNTGDGWVFSFENICNVLELNPEYVRKGLIRWEEKQPSRHAGARPLWKNPKKTSAIHVSAPSMR